MENKKVILGSLALLALGGAWLVYKMTKSEKVEKEGGIQDEVAQQVENEGGGDVGGEPENIAAPTSTVTEEKTSDLCGDSYNNLCKSLYESIRFSPDYEREIVDVDRILSGNTKGVIHVNLYESRGEDYITFFLEIPQEAGERAIGAFVSEMRKGAEYMKREILPYSASYRSRLSAKYVLEYTEVGNTNKISSITEIPVEEIEQLGKEKDLRYNESVGSFVSEIRKLLDSGQKLVLEDASGSFENIEIKEILLGYEISFPLESEKYPGGANLSRSLHCINYLINQPMGNYLEGLLIKYRGGELEYRSILFYNPFSIESDVYEAVEKEEGKYTTEISKISYF